MTNEVLKAMPETPRLGEVGEPADPMVSMIERIAMSPDLPIDRLEKMLDMKERMDKQSARAQHAAAFAKASAEIPVIPMNGRGHNKMPYATLKDIIAHTRPVLSRHGLALNFSVETADAIRVTARLSHTAGHVEVVSIDLPRDTSGSKNAVQAVGSSQTYGQRYTAQAILGLSLGEDVEDDGRTATGDVITPEQLSDLRDLAKSAGVAEDVVCKAQNIAALDALPATKFENVKSRLKATIAKKKEQANA